MARENMVGTSVRLPKALLDRLERVAGRSRWSKGELHRQALEFFLPVLESGHHLAKWFPSDEVPPGFEDYHEPSEPESR